MALLIAFALAVVLAGKEAEAQTINAVPNSGVSWNVGAGSSAPSVSLSGNQLAVVQSLAVTAVLMGVTQVWPVGRAISVGASVMGAAGRQILQSQMVRGALTGAALAAALALTGDTKYDSGSNTLQTAAVGIAGDAPGTGYYYNGAISTLASTPAAACQALGDQWWAGSTSYWSGWNYAASVDSSYRCTVTLTAKGNPNTKQVVYNAVVVQKQANSFTPQYAPSTNAQIENAIAGSSGSWTNLWQAGGCDAKANSYVDLALSAQINDPCAVIVTGGSPSPATVPTTNNPYGWPAQQWTKAYNGLTETHTLQTSSAVSANSGADMKSNPVAVQTTVTETVASKDSAGNTTTTTTTTAGPTETKSDAPATAATFNGQTGSLYTKRSRTWSGVLNDFANTVKGAPWYAAAVGFFNVTIAGASCPHWTATATKWTPALDATPYVCSSTMTTLYAMGGVVVLAVAAWAAFRIAFL